MHFRGALFKCLHQGSMTRMYCQDEQRGDAKQTRRQNRAPGVRVRAAKDCGHRGDTALGSLQRRRGEEGRRTPSGLTECALRVVAHRHWLEGSSKNYSSCPEGQHQGSRRAGLQGRLNPQSGVCLGTSPISLLETTGGPQSRLCDGITLNKASHLSEPLSPQE